MFCFVTLFSFTEELRHHPLLEAQRARTSPLSAGRSSFGPQTFSEPSRDRKFKIVLVLVHVSGTTPWEC